MFKSWKLEKVLPWLLIICGTIGLICAFIISYEKIQLLKNPHYVPSCDLNPVVSCGSVMASKQAEAFGFPNPFIGLMGFPVVITTGVVMLAHASHVQKLKQKLFMFKRWYMLGLEGGAIFGLLFVHWLFYNSVYRIDALCPYCMVVWVITITTFWYVTLYNIQMKNIVLPSKLAPAAAWVRKHHLDILVLWLLIIATLILKHFWYYYGQYF